MGSVSIASYGYESVDVLMATTSITEKDWVLDSGCSFHMTLMKEWFLGYKETDGGIVVMGNNNVCNVVGIGSIRIRLDDRTKKTLSRVRHVPGLKRNLISLGLLAGEGVLKVIKGALVATSGNRENGIYTLKGRAIKRCCSNLKH